MAAFGNRANVTLDRAALNRLLTSPNGDTARYVIRKSNDLRNNLVSLSPVDTGELKQGWQVRFETYKGQFSGLVENRVRHALVVMLGSRPHVIRPSRARMLRFRPSGSQAFVFARAVYHPGTQPNDFWREAIRRLRP